MVHIEKSLWAVEFLSNVGKLGTGIVTIDGNAIFGGNSLYYYIGEYKLENENASSIIAVTKYAAGESVFGAIASFNLLLKGVFSTNNMSLVGEMIENPQFTINVNLKKLRDLI